uniref:Tail tape measure protein n=1 Tax=Siphoviridae sp. ctMCY8 TaxID=2827854 RepID=A0A8S5TAN5_9CAUD|nr:MAG TPA: tail tape measure protein [Siphoviridae sp. ctMCY8]
MDTSSFEQGVDRAKAKTSALAGELNPRFSGIGKTLTSAFVKSQLLATSVIALAKKFSSLGEGIVNQGVAFNQQMEKYTTGFTNMLGSAEKAQAVLNQIKQDAARTPLNVDSLVQANQLLISAGVSAGEARSTILALGDAVSATGGGSEVLSRMAANLQQIKNVGKAASIDIKQFAYAGINIYQVLADYTGKSVQEVQGMTITYDLLTAALKKASEEGGRYYNAMETQSQTLSGRLETLKDNWSQLLGTLTKGLTETEGNLVTAAAGWVQRLQEGFETAGANGLMQAGGHIVDEVASGISAGIPSLAARAEDAVQNFALYLQDNTGQIADTGGKLLVSLASGILDMAPAIVNSAEQIFSAFVVELWNHADEIFTTGADLVGKLVKGFLSLTGNVIEAAGNITAAIVIEVFTTDWVQVGKDVVSSIGQGILDGISALSTPLDRLSYKLNHALGKTGYAEYSTFEAWAAANGKTDETRYQQGSQKDTDYWKRYGDKLTQQYGLNGTGTDTGSGETDATPGGSSRKRTGTKPKTETVIASVAHTATTTAQNALGAVTTSVETLNEKVKDTAGNIKNRVTETTTETGKEMVNGVATTYKKVTKTVDGVVQKETKVYDDMSKTLLGTLTIIAEKTFNGITTTTQQAVETYADGSQHIKTTATETGERIVDGVRQTYTKVISYIDGVQDKVTETAQNIDKSIKATQKRIEENLSKAQQQFNSGIFKIGKNLYTDLKNQDWAALGLDIVNMMWGEVSQEQREVLSDWANKALEAINEAYSGGGLSEAFNAFKQIMSNGIKAEADGVTTDVKGLSKVFQDLGINVSDVGSKIMGVLGTMGTGIGTFVSNAGTGIAKLAGSMGSLGTIAKGAGGLIAKIGGLIISNPEVAAIIAIVAGVVALGAALFAKFGKSSGGGQAVSHYESPFAGHDVYDSLTEFSTRAAMQHRYMEKTTGTDAQLGILQQIRDMLDEHLPDIGTGQLVMDGEKVADMLTPRLATNMDASMGVYTLRAERGV